MTFLVTNLACFLLKIGSAPNFRPSFHFFNWETAAVGTVVCGATMFFVDGFYASGCVGLLVILFLLIHYTTPPKPWGDVSQGLIYHQVRKYLLRLRQEHVKFWRPQILLLVNDPGRQYKLIQFCNSLKKGGLFVLGHVIVSQDFGAAVPEARQQQQSWTKYIDFSKIKAFVNIAISPAIEWGARNLVLGAGLGGMRPNVVVMGFYNLPELRESQPRIGIPSPQPSRPTSKAANHPLSRKAVQAAARRKETNVQTLLPTAAMRPESAIAIRSYVTIIEDLVLRLQANVAIAKGFQDLEVPSPKPSAKHKALAMIGLSDIEIDEPTKKYIDLWPIQMSADTATAGEEPSRKNVLTTNFDTYTLILQLGCILQTVPSWKRTYKLRVCVFVEYETDVEEERGRVVTLLRNLRIEAEVLVFWLASGDLSMYEVIINGKDDGDFDQTARDIDFSLEDERWWQDIKRLRQPDSMSASQELAQTVDILDAVTSWPVASFRHGRDDSKPKRFAALQKMLRKARRKSSVGGSVGVHLLGSDLADSDSDFAQPSLSESGQENDADDADDEAILSESEAAVSGSNFDEYDLDASGDESDYGSAEQPSPPRRTKTLPSSIFSSRRLDLRRAIWKGSPKDGSLKDNRPTSDSVTPLRPHPGATASDTALLQKGHKKKSRSIASSSSQLSSSSPARSVVQVAPVGQQSLPKFTSNPQPRTIVATNEAPGPSIMFVDTPKPDTSEKKDPIATTTGESSKPAATVSSSIYTPATISSKPSVNTLGASSEVSQPSASGFPAQQAIPISFNDLPCRAQHLILNELLRRQSDDTAVVFTTLPSPMEGTCESEAESVKYISDLEVLTQGLPPVLLVHSNSMTVTMNL